MMVQFIGGPLDGQVREFVSGQELPTTWHLEDPPRPTEPASRRVSPEELDWSKLVKRAADHYRLRPEATKVSHVSYRWFQVTARL